MKVLNKTKRLCVFREVRWSGALAPGSCANIPQRNAVWIFSGGSSGGWAHGHKQTCGTYGLKSRGSLCVLLRKPSNICGFLADTFHFMALSTVQHFNRICPVNFPICWEQNERNGPVFFLLPADGALPEPGCDGGVSLPLSPKTSVFSVLI